MRRISFSFYQCISEFKKELLLISKRSRILIPNAGFKVGEIAKKLAKNSMEKENRIIRRVWQELGWWWVGDR
jgi:hypothetical protein